MKMTLYMRLLRFNPSKIVLFQYAAILVLIFLVQFTLVALLFTGTVRILYECYYCNRVEIERGCKLQIESMLRCCHPVF